MAEKKNSLIARILIPPVIFCAGVMALWENEGRFNYFKAAKESLVIESAAFSTPDTTVAMTGALDTSIPVNGKYIEPVTGYYMLSRSAQIYSWDRDKDSDGNVTWSKGWYSHLDNNSRNQGLRQTLKSGSMYPSRYELGDLEVDPTRIHFVDGSVGLAMGSIGLTQAAASAGLTPQGEYLYKYVGGGAGPNLGDERLHYTGVPNSSTATYFGLIKGRVGDKGLGVGKQFEVSTSFISAIIQNDGVLHHLVNGDRDTALSTMKSHFKRLKWIVRGAGTFAVVMGIFFFFSGFVNLLYRIPLLGDVIQGGVFVVSLVLGLAISITVMVSSAFVHHPFMVALPVIAFVAMIIYLRRKQGEAKDNANATLERYQAKATREDQPSDQAAISAASPTEAAVAVPAAASVASGPGIAEVGLPGLGASEALFLNLARIALADDALNKKEKNFLIEQGRKSGIDADRMKELFAEAKAGEGQVHAATRDDVVIATCLAMADGRISRGEMSHLMAMGKKIGLDAADVHDIIIEVGEPAGAKA